MLINIAKSKIPVYDISRIRRDDLDGCYLFPILDFWLNYTLNNVDWRSQYEDVSVDELLPVQQRYVHIAANTIKNKGRLINEIDGQLFVTAFSGYNSLTGENFLIAARIKNNPIDDFYDNAYNCEINFLNDSFELSDILLAPTNYFFEVKDNTVVGTIRDKYITYTKPKKLSVFEYRVLMDKQFYAKTTFRVADYFSNGGKSLKQSIDLGFER